jgi:mono/diheme cytochrome c family protein
MLSRTLALTLAMAMAPAVGRADAGSFEKDVLPILNSQCVMCHVAGAELGGLSLYPDAWLSLVGIASKESSLKLVDPGVPDKSYMYLKLTNAQDSVGGSGLQMPPTHRLDDTQIEAIRRWIEQGAKPN